MQLSDKAIEDLKSELIQKYGSTFSLSDEELNEIGVFLLTSLAESIKHKIIKSSLIASL